MNRSIDIRRITLTALMAALVFVLTLIPRFPLFTTGGYIHLGDAGITFAAVAFGPWVAAIAGGLGTALADLVGFPQWAIFSFLVHGFQGFVLGLMLRWKLNWVTVVLSTIVGVFIVATGYFLAGAILQGVAVSLTEVPFNIAQALSGSLVGLPLYWAVRRSYPPIDAYRERES